MLRRLYHNVQSVLSLLGPYKKTALFLLFVLLCVAFFEAIGLGMVIPLLATILTADMTGISSNAISLFNEVYSEFVPEGMKVMGICLLILGIFLIKNGFIYLRTVMASYFQNSLRHFWSTIIMEKYITAEYNYIISHKRGSLINNLINEPLVSSKFMFRLIMLIARILVITCVYTMMLIINWKITLYLSLAVGAILSLFMLMSKKVAVSIGKERLPLIQEITADGEQSLNAIRQVKLFSGERIVWKNFSNKFAYLKKLLVKLEIYRNIPERLGEILVISGFVTVLIYYEYVMKTAIATIIPLLAFVVLSAQKIFQNASVVVSDRMFLITYLPSIRLINTILTGKEIKREELTTGLKIDQLQHDIVFEEVSFSYNNSNAVLKNLSLSIQKNMITAFVGKSGSGKSTIVDVLCGLYKGYSGRIQIGNHELRNYNLSSLRKIIGFVSQDTFLFNTSIRENILIGKHTSTEEEMVQAAKQANIHEFIMTLPKGYDTVLGDRGLKVSGGQRQRITIARALVRDPQLLIFDEATSSLDSESEKLIQESIEELRNNKTIIIISHRLSTIKNADLIYVLDKGEIIESGTYKALMNKQKLFSRMVLEQN